MENQQQERGQKQINTTINSIERDIIQEMKENLRIIVFSKWFKKLLQP